LNCSFQHQALLNQNYQLMKPKIKILLVEDDPNLSLVLQDYLEMQGYTVVLCHDGVEGLDAFENEPFDICILDVMMPRKDGFTLAEEIRTADSQIPIVFLTAKAMKEDRISGFKKGCDDYITKPFSSEELNLRLQAILKRCLILREDPLANKPEFITIGSYIFNYKNLQLINGSNTIVLTRKEADLLLFFSEHRNELLPRETILNAVWGNDDYFIGRSMDVFITKLRKYMRDDKSISINNVHGIGFVFEVK
jgi:DNA-binding response OmpR family regulator